MAVDEPPVSPPANLSWRNFALFVVCFAIDSALEVYGRREHDMIKTWCVCALNLNLSCKARKDYSHSLLSYTQGTFLKGVQVQAQE